MNREMRYELTALSQRYARFADDGRFADLAGLFASAGVLKTPTSERVGPAEIEQAVSGLARFESTFHLLGQVELWLENGEPRGLTYCQAHHFGIDDDGRTTDHIMHIRYHDRFVDEGGWKFAHRRLEVLG